MTELEKTEKALWLEELERELDAVSPVHKALSDPMWEMIKNDRSFFLNAMRVVIEKTIGSCKDIVRKHATYVSEAVPIGEVLLDRDTGAVVAHLYNPSEAKVGEKLYYTPIGHSISMRYSSEAVKRSSSVLREVALALADVSERLEAELKRNEQ